MKYDIVLKAREDGRPTEVSVTFHVPGTEDDREWVKVLGNGRDGRANPFHPIDEAEKSEAFERARRTAIAVFEGVAGLTRRPRLMPLNEWLRANPGRLRDLSGRKLLWIDADENMPVEEVSITQAQMESLLNQGWADSPVLHLIANLEVASERDGPKEAFRANTDQLYVRLEFSGCSRRDRSRGLRPLE